MNLKNIWQFLGLTQDRIGRRRFLIAFFSAQWGLPLAILLVMGLFYLVFGEDNPILFLLFLPALVFFASLIFGLVVYIKISIRRVHDIGIAQSWWVLAIIPLINFFFFIYLCLEKSGAGQAGSFSLTNLTREQFRRFFSHEFSKPFMIVCCGVIVAGAIIAGSAVSNLKQNIDIKITQREDELDKIYNTRDQKSDIEYQARNEKYKECISEYKRERPWLDNSFYISPSLSGCGRKPYNYQILRLPYKYLEDASYKELSRIKNTSSFQLFFEKFGFGRWGIIALMATLLINILIVLFKFSAKYFPIVIRSGGAQAKLMKSSIRDMSIFQRYLLLIALLILITLVFVLIKL